MTSNSLKKSFGVNVSRRRKQLDMSQNDLAEACDVSVESISHIERGIHSPRFDLLETLANALDIKVYKLFVF